MAPSAVVRCVVAVLSCVISSYLFAKCNRKKRSVWARTWIKYKKRAWCFGNAFKRTSCRNHMRMSVTKLEELLQMVGPKIQKRETVFRTPIPARTKLELTL